MTYGPENTEGPFLSNAFFFPENGANLNIKLTDMYSKMSSSVNIKEIAVYETSEIVTGQQFYNATDYQNRRIGFRKVFPLEAEGAGGTITIPHGITGIVQCTAIKGCAFMDNDDWRPIPYASASNITHQVSVHINSTDLIVHIGAGSPGIVFGQVTVEYLKN